MNSSRFINDLQAGAGYEQQIAHVEQLAPRMARHASPQAPLPAILQRMLERQGIEQLYTHQAAALDAVRSGAHVGVVTATASGKSLTYQLPTLEAIGASYRRRALWLFPTRALAQDQLRAIGALVGPDLPALRVGVYDGDTPRPERATLRAGANILISNPDMLHVGILPNHTLWGRFLSNLAFVVVDEAHIYRGVFGSHVALVLRRLRRLCASYGSRPQFLLCSATIGNPAEHLELLLGDRVTVIDDDGAPAGPRTVVFWNPPLLADAEAGARRSSNSESTALLVALLQREIKTLAFTRARKIAELLLRYTREALARADLGQLAARLASYRAGYLAEQRRQVEQALFRGDLLAVIATNAMELGVDIGGLDAVLLNGFPGTIASTWQQIGRAGRSGAASLALLVALADPIDQFYMRHPERFFARSHEAARIAPSNPYILADHLRCAAFERPLERAADEGWFGPLLAPLVNELVEDGLLVLRHGRACAPAAGDPRAGGPAAAIDIRSAAGRPFELVDAEQGRLIERIDAARAFFEIHPGAIHLHQGEPYLVLDLDLAAQRATARAVEVDYYTQPRDITDIQIVEAVEEIALGPATAAWGEVDVSRRVVGFRRKAHYTEEVQGDVELDLPPQSFPTRAVWFVVPAELAQPIRLAGRDLAGGLHALEHTMIALLPALAMCDRWDIGGVSTPWHPDTGAATVFIYDGVPGGVGISELGFARLREWWQATAELLAACPCKDGCPSCIQSPKCGNGNEPLDKQVALELVTALLALPGSAASSNA